MTGETSGTTRRRLFASGLFLLARHAVGALSTSREPASHDNANVDYGRATLPREIRSRRINTNNQVVLHTLEAGFESPGRPCVVLLHGFPELAYTWRNQMLPLAAAGYYVVAPGNKPFPLKSWTAPELAKMPTYYIMDLNKGVAETMAEYQPSSEYIATCKWMTEADLQVYATQFSRTGFQGGLNYYRADYDEPLWNELNSFAGKTIDVPACYIGGAKEWAVYQNPGAFQAMDTVCTRLSGVHLVPGAGHSIVEEKPDSVNQLLIDFLNESRG